VVILRLPYGSQAPLLCSAEAKDCLRNALRKGVRHRMPQPVNRLARLALADLSSTTIPSRSAGRLRHHRALAEALAYESLNRSSSGAPIARSN